MHTLKSITRIVNWLCKKLSFDELLIAITILLQVINDERDDIRPRNDFKEKHPNYREYVIDPLPPVTQRPVIEKLDYKILLKEYKNKTGKELKPVKRHKTSIQVPSNLRCKRCNAPSEYLYFNDGRKKSQLLCKVCDNLSQSVNKRTQSDTKYWCPHCGWALYLWKKNDVCAIFKCGNKKCSCYLKNLQKLNLKEKELLKTGMKSQFKLCYQYREYHFSPADLITSQPLYRPGSFNRIHNSFNTVGLVLDYSVSFGISARMTAQILKNVHCIDISYQTVLNYIENAAPLAYRFFRNNIDSLSDQVIAGDETYIRVDNQWNYTWFVIGCSSRTIRAFNISSNRGVLPALATLTHTVEQFPENAILPVELITDGNPAYDAAIHAINTDIESKPLIQRKVIGLENINLESEQFRPFKQLIERLNRTYKFHTRARSGFKNSNGAVALTTLFVTYYNFLRPHHTLNHKPPIILPIFNNISTIQGKWLKLLQSAA